MPNGFFSYSQNTFPTENPPTWLHPASPKNGPAKTVKEIDNASMHSTSTFASTVSLLKENVKAKLHSKNNNVRKASDATMVDEKESSKEPSPRAQTTEHYRIMAEMRH